jgi:hypothetical protein
VPTELVTAPTAIMRQYLAQKNAQERDHSQGSEDPFLRSFGAGSGMSYSSAISHTPPRFTPASYEISHMKRARAGSISGRLRRYEVAQFVLPSLISLLLQQLRAACVCLLMSQRLAMYTSM